ncbi:PREDICTED: calmodulin-beta-like [Branchiostoma belcheri]|uniref:Calmodulin-beta-like n=1 Tax=Branchiostoma belcheri TaxID=7741 RepID=A0A6P5A5V8_BRABE|nr:PREDICTED: calmodulin-beta-like [Branchiostoma belcheri]
MASALAPPDDKQLSLYRKCFDMLDKNNDEFISPTELGPALAALSIDPSPSLIKGTIKTFDVDENGKLDFNEFVNFMQHMKEVMSPEPRFLMEAFKSFDKDGSGTLNKAEVKSAMATIGRNYNDEQIDKLFELFDSNRDGVLQYEEFVNLMNPRRSQNLPQPEDCEERIIQNVDKA